MKDQRFKRILVTGSTGFLGHHILPRLRETFEAEFVCVSSKDYDLLHPGTPEKMIRDVQPDCVVHLAAKSGGIMDNRNRPAHYYYDNIVFCTHVMHEAWRGGVKKFLSLMGGCSYPGTATSPIDEAQMWEGLPQIDSLGYSMAKKMLLIQSWAYRKQYGFNAVTLIPGNLYGEWDNFNLEQAHVIPAMIRKYIEAKEAGRKEMIAFGTGRPTRDFVYAGDVAATIPWFLANYDSSEPVNISAGRRISIRELADTVKKVTGFPGEIVWDTTKPDGQIDKIFDVRRLNALGLSCDTTLEAGLKRTAEWFVAARARGEVRL